MYEYIDIYECETGDSVDYFDPNSQLLPWLLYYYSSLLGLLPGIRASYEVSKEVAKIHKFRLVIYFLFML